MVAASPSGHEGQKMPEELVDGAVDAGASQSGTDALDALDALSDEQQVPVSVVKAIRKELQETKKANEDAQNRFSEELRQRDDQLFLYRTELNRLSQGHGGQDASRGNGNGRTQTGTFLDELEDDEPLTAAQAKQLLLMSGKNTQTQTALAKAQMDPDFQALTTTHIANVLKADPDLVQELAALPPAERYLRAYRLAKSDPAYHQGKLVLKPEKGEKGEPVIKPNEKAQQIEANLKKPGSPASVRPGDQTSNEADQIKGMTRAEFKAYRNKKIQDGLAARR